MSRIGLVAALLLALAAIGVVSITTISGPGAHRQPPPASVASSGPLRIPVPGVAPAALVDSWSDPRDGGTRAHRAIDIPAAQGAAVVAAADGRIEKLFTSVRGGLTIYERAADGDTIFYYAHLDRYAPTLVEGQAVRAGQVVAAVGATGDADPATPHLHFEIHRLAPGERWWQGSEIDPYPLLRAAGQPGRLAARPPRG